MFGFLSLAPQQHPTLGTLVWSKGYWRGSIALGASGPVPLVLAGNKSGPHAAAIAEGLRLRDVLALRGDTIGLELQAHAEVYEADPCPASPAEALVAARLVAVVIAPVDGAIATEFCLTVPWDVEHTLGARLRDGEWLELNGSTLVP